MNIPVKFELAKLLKEKGFDEPCRFVYDDWNNIEDWYDIGREYHRNSEKNASVYYSAPTIAEVVMRIYKKYGIWIIADIFGDYFKPKIINKNAPIGDGYLSDCKGKLFNSPTEAYEAAIEYTLNNLI